jgi:hypothetical protein
MNTDKKKTKKLDYQTNFRFYQCLPVFICGFRESSEELR